MSPVAAEADIRAVGGSSSFDPKRAFVISPTLRTMVFISVALDGETTVTGALNN